MSTTKRPFAWMLALLRRQPHPKGGPPHPEDLEEWGRILSEAHQRYSVKVATEVWNGWVEKIEAGKPHPSNRDLAAFLRGFSEPLGGWLPEGMAGYVADRLQNPKKHGNRRSGPRPVRFFDHVSRAQKEVELAMMIVWTWREHQAKGIPNPQEAAIRDVTREATKQQEALGLDLAVSEPGLSVIFSRHREAAERFCDEGLSGQLDYILETLFPEVDLGPTADGPEK